MRNRLVAFSLFWLWPMCLSAATPYRDCARLDWEYQPHPEVVAFAIYVSRHSGTYNFEEPVDYIPAIPTLVTESICRHLTLVTPGTYYVVVQARHISGKDEGHSKPSNEIQLVVGNPSPSLPATPSPSPLDPVPSPSPSPRLPPPPPFPWIPPSPPISPPSGLPGGWITDDPAWRGQRR